MINEDPQKIFQSLPPPTPNFLLTDLSTETKTSETDHKKSKGQQNRKVQKDCIAGAMQLGIGGEV